MAEGGVIGKTSTPPRPGCTLMGKEQKQPRHYGPVAQEFFAAFGHDGIGTIGTPTTITSTDMAGGLMIAGQAPEESTPVLQQEKKPLKEAREAPKAQKTELRGRLQAAGKQTIAKE